MRIGHDAGTFFGEGLSCSRNACDFVLSDHGLDLALSNFQELLRLKSSHHLGLSSRRHLFRSLCASQLELLPFSISTTSTLGSI